MRATQAPWQRRGPTATAASRELEQALLEKALALSLEEQSTPEVSNAAVPDSGVSLQHSLSEEMDRCANEVCHSPCCKNAAAHLPSGCRMTERDRMPLRHGILKTTPGHA